MTKCNYYALQDTYTLMEEKLSALIEKIEELKLNADIENININLGNLETQLESVVEALNNLDFSIDVDSLDIDLDNLEQQLISIGEKIEAIDLSIDVDSIDVDLDNLEQQLTNIADIIDAKDVSVDIGNIDTNLDSIETELSHIKLELETLRLNLDSNINFTSIQSSLIEIANQLKISNQIEILNSINEDILTDEKKQRKYMDIKIALFGSDDPVDPLDDDDTHHDTSDPVTPQPTIDLTDDDNPILNP